MSELINIQKQSLRFLNALLSNTSGLALLSAILASPGALAAADEERPSVWIELGGQLERVDTPQTILNPPFFNLAIPPVLNTLVDSQRPSRYSNGADGKITIVPEATDWVLSAAVRYGRTKNARHLHYQTPGLPTVFNTSNLKPVVNKPVRRNYGDGQSNFAESHFLLDFQVGKDVGLGLFGMGGNSVISVGVRYAQFTSSSDATLHARPVLGYAAAIQYKTSILHKYHSIHHPFSATYAATVHTTRHSHGVGPSVSWDASLPVAGSREGLTMAFDWGLTGALLFGKQQTAEGHRTTGYGAYFLSNVKHTHSYAHGADHARTKSMLIPNVGGFAGVSLKFPNAKVSLGYRGDFFFNATDSGLDARDAANRNFYGPFATVSIGLGG